MQIFFPDGLLIIFKSVFDSILFLPGVCLFSYIPDCKDTVQGRFYLVAADVFPWKVLMQMLNANCPCVLGGILAQFSTTCSS